jgi:hypothetical protein
MQGKNEQWRLLFNFLGLNWSDDFLDIQPNRRVINTISSTQVRQGIDRRYLNRSNKYGDLLSSFKQLLSMSIEDIVELPMQ